MTDYKNTLNLPHTDFPMKANLAQRELELLNHWQEIDIYQALRKKGHQRKKFILSDGPPYANGHLHLGHAVNKVLKDIVVKSRTLSGFDAPFVPGWDCHGLPIELNVEKKWGKPGVKLSHKEFRQKCREYAAEQIDIQREEFQRLGVLGDWKNPYRTMDFKFEADVIRSLGKIIEKGHLQRGFKPVHWCIECGSALAEAEVEYEPKTSLALDVRFRLKEPQKFLPNIPISIPIWTTTAWTLPANQAVAVNGSHEYSIITLETEQGTEGLIIATVLLESVLARYGIKKYKEHSRILGSELEHLRLAHPFYDREVPVVLGDHVTLDAGTGAVHTAPAHGQDDYAVAKHYNLLIDNPVGPNGCFLADTKLFAGEHVFKVDTHVLEVLKEHKNLLHAEKIEHSYPNCWRHKIPLIFRATPQWFISMDKQNLRAQAEEAVTQVKWVPSWGQERMFGMIKGRPDWCISRQRDWGVPIALFVHEQTSELHPDTPKLIEAVAKLVEQKGVDAWINLEPKELGISSDYVKVTDTLDVWFDSGVVHECVLLQRPDLQFPADLYLEGSDQHRGWFQSSLLTSVAVHNKAPYKAVLTHGFTVDAQGRKMSKSIGNVIAPEKIINTLGADILRLWIASADYRGELAFSDEIIKRVSDSYRRIRNTARFLLANLAGFDPTQDLLAPTKMIALDRWILDRARVLQDEIIKAYDEYQFHLVFQKIHNFCSLELSSFYLDIIKDRQYTTPKDSLARRSAQTALYHIVEAMVRWLAPILSFTAEEIWKYIPGPRDTSVFLSTWYEQFPIQKDLMNWDLIIEVRNAVNKELERQRNEGQIGSALEAEVSLYCPPNSQLSSVLTQIGDELRFVLITSKAELISEDSQDAVHELLSNGECLTIITNPSNNPKCTRCWHRRPMSTIPEYAEICDRCVSNITTKEGEKRQYA